MTSATTIFGYGPVGRATAALLAGRGYRVRVVQRTTPARLPVGADFLKGDLLDRASVEAAAQGASHVVCAVGLPYRSAVWERDWPVVMANLIAACEATGARLVFADNLYMVGPQTAPLVETMPLTDYGLKPKVRAAITRQWQAAHEAGRIRAVAVRASDFYGPDVATSVITEFGVRRLLAGKAALVPYSPDHPHDFTYVPDFARAIASLIDAPDDAYGSAWHVPNAPTMTLRAVLSRAAELAGVPLKISVMPDWIKPLVGLFVPEVAEMREMRFQTDRPYHVDHSKFAARFWSDPTPFDTGLKATIAACREAA
ncbi:MAG: NAD-dependent epimerase/dehydratase family protein [Rhodobiaceae bacterium]|nr:NAD-dependent epimerase/dehydratase family protein [Rhodobiaceae bacterium]